MIRFQLTLFLILLNLLSLSVGSRLESKMNIRNINHTTNQTINYDIKLKKNEVVNPPKISECVNTFSLSLI
jgi:hypothetical protein